MTDVRFVKLRRHHADSFAYDCQFSKWPTVAILIYEIASMETTRDDSNFDFGHIQVAFLKFSACYIFFPSPHSRKSNTRGLSKETDDLGKNSASTCD